MTKRVTIEEIRKLSHRSRILLYGDQSTWVQSAASGNSPKMPNTAINRGPDDTTVRMAVRPFSELDRQLNTTKPLNNALRIMIAQSKHVPPFLFRHEASILGNVKGGASLLEAEKEALRHNLIVKHRLPHAKTNTCLWEVTDQGYERIEQTRPQWGSKGGYMHKFSVHRIEHTYRRHGYHTEIEHRRPNGKLVDERVSKDDHVQYIEVCASWPIQKELVNIEKDLEGEPLPDEIILAVTERNMRKPLEQAIREMNAHTKLARPVRIALAGDLIGFLEIAT